MKAFEHQGHAVELSEAGQFVWNERKYDTATAVREAIDRHERHKVITAKKKLALPVINKKGRALAITGVHAGNGNLLMNPKPGDGYDDKTVYPDCEQVRALIVRRAQLLEVESALSRVQISWSSYRVNNLSPEAQYRALEEEYAAKLARAKEQ